jgi:hypothetical protein
MPDRQEVMSSLYGAFRLALFDENGVNHFNISVEGFWRSFFAAVILLPFYALMVWNTLITAQGELSMWAILVNLLVYGLSWILFPIVAFFATDLLNLGHRFTALVVAVNWSSVLIVGAFAVSIGLAALLQNGLADLILIAATAGLVVYHWFVIKTALATTTPIALAFVLFNFLLGAMLQQVGDRLL